MHLITNGSVKVGDKHGAGKLLFTGRSLFVFKSKIEAAALGGAAGGLVGALIGLLIDKFTAKKTPPAHFDDPEITELGETVRSQLLATELLAKLSLDSNLSVEPTRFGFVFTTGPTVVKYGGWTKKKEIARFLDTHGVRISDF